MFADRVAVIDGDERYTYARVSRPRAAARGRAARARASTDGARVAVLAPNTHVLLEAHYGVPFAGAVLVALNPRLTAGDLARIVAHAGAAVLIYDHEFEAVAAEIARKVGAALKLVRAGGDDEYEAMLARGRRRMRAPSPTSAASSRSTTRAAPPASRKASCTTTAAPTCRRSRWRSHTRLDSRQRLPVDAADVPLQRLVLHLGASPPRARRTCACASSIPSSSGSTCASPASRISTPRRRC